MTINPAEQDATVAGTIFSEATVRTDAIDRIHAPSPRSSSASTSTSASPPSSPA